MTGGSRAPWVIGNHDVPRPVSRYAPGRGQDPEPVDRLPRAGRPGAEAGARRARAAALMMLALPGSAYIYQGEELGLPEVVDMPARPGRTPVPPYPRRKSRPRRLPRAHPLGPYR